MMEILDAFASRQCSNLRINQKSVVAPHEIPNTPKANLSSIAAACMIQIPVAQA